MENKRQGMNRRWMGLAMAMAMTGCAGLAGEAAGPTGEQAASPVPAGPQRYRCDRDIAFTVRFGDDTAVLDLGSRGIETLSRDAGGVTPQQTVYSSPKIRVEFGLGESAREAVLRYLEPPFAVRCQRGPT